MPLRFEACAFNLRPNHIFDSSLVVYFVLVSRLPPSYVQLAVIVPLPILGTFCRVVEGLIAYLQIRI